MMTLITLKELYCSPVVPAFVENSNKTFGQMLVPGMLHELTRPAAGRQPNVFGVMGW